MVWCNTQSVNIGVKQVYSFKKTNLCGFTMYQAITGDDVLNCVFDERGVSVSEFILNAGNSALLRAAFEVTCNKHISPAIFTKGIQLHGNEPSALAKYYENAPDDLTVHTNATKYEYFRQLIQSSEDEELAALIKIIAEVPLIKLHTLTPELISSITNLIKE